MIGNIYICLNEATYNSEIPVELQGKYARTSVDDEDNLVEILPTTFAEIGEDNRRAYGVVRQFSINDANFYILEFSASWLSGEVSALLNLGVGLDYPNNTLLTNKEAQQLLSEHAEDIA
jgi:hypothetical protein